MSNINNEVTEIRRGFDRVYMAIGKAKEDVIRDLREHSPIAFNAMVLYLNPAVVFHLGMKSLNKNVGRVYRLEKETFLSIAMALNDKVGVTDDDIASVQGWMEVNLDAANKQFAAEYLCKTYRLGVTAKTLNKAVGYEAIPMMQCMLANKYFEHPKTVEGKSFTLSLKLDGIRCLCVADRNGAKFFSRQGQRIEGLVELEEEIGSIFACQDIKIPNLDISNGIAFDGELLVDGGLKMVSKTAYKLTTNIVRKNGEKHGVSYQVFDIMTADEFQARRCTRKYAKRKEHLDWLFDSELAKSWKHLHRVPYFYHGSDTSVIVDYVKAAREADQEGVMLNIDDAPYEFKRTNNLLKVKVFQDCDLRIIDVLEGSGKFESTCGALVCEYKGNPVGVGTGLTDNDRDFFWHNKDRLIGRIATIQYFEETVDKDGKPSLRFPVYLRLREDKTEPSYN